MDVICQAKSGMGKTAVFVLSTLQQIEPVAGQVSAIVLCHTRELAYQVYLISSIFKRLIKHVCFWLLRLLVCLVPHIFFIWNSVDLSWVWEIQHILAWSKGCCLLRWCQHQSSQGFAEKWMPSYCCWNAWKNIGTGKREGPFFEECEAFYSGWMWQDAWITWYKT